MMCEDVDRCQVVLRRTSCFVLRLVAQIERCLVFFTEPSFHLVCSLGLGITIFALDTALTSVRVCCLTSVRARSARVRTCLVDEADCELFIWLGKMRSAVSAFAIMIMEALRHGPPLSGIAIEE